MQVARAFSTAVQRRGGRVLGAFELGYHGARKTNAGFWSQNRLLHGLSRAWMLKMASAAVRIMEHTGRIRSTQVRTGVLIVQKSIL